MNTVTPTIPTTMLSGGAIMPLVGFGTHPLRDEEAATAVATAIDVGFRSIDTATRYRNQRAVGEGIRRSGIDRSELFLTSKLPPDAVGREREVLEQSLEEFGTEHLDLWLIHWPPGGSASIKAWEEFIRAKQDGLVRAIGVSNHPVKLLDTLGAATGHFPEVDQLQWSPVHFSERFLRGCQERGVVVGAHSPFRSARLEDPVLLGIGEAHGVSTRQVIVRWNVQHGVAVVPKSAHRDRMATNLDIDFVLSPQELSMIDGLSELG